jgi:molybdate transport system ATP-binding protein
VIYVSHDAPEVARLADRVIRMDAGRLGPAREAASADPLAILSEAQVRTLARAALAAGLEAGP